MGGGEPLVFLEKGLDLAVLNGDSVFEDNGARVVVGPNRWRGVVGATMVAKEASVGYSDFFPEFRGTGRTVLSSGHVPDFPAAEACLAKKNKEKQNGCSISEIILFTFRISLMVR